MANRPDQWGSYRSSLEAYRTLSLAEDTILVLKQQRKETGSSPCVFPSPTGGPISPDNVLYMLHRVLKWAGLPKVRFHDLAPHLRNAGAQNGVDIKTVPEMLGHFSAGFTMDTFAHVTIAAQKAHENDGKSPGEHPIMPSK